ncbi:tachylectin-related carbohydrate-binding protein [Microbacter sp. GSS18]|nr:tachylectin-related carbohydrate-binding protein [Microbacter sp. GSS18]
MLVIRYIGTPSGSGGYGPQFRPEHDEAYFRDFFFERADSVAAFIEHVSHGAVRFSRRGPLVAPKIYSAQRFDAAGKPRSSEQIRTELLTAAAEDIDFSIFDDDQTGLLTNGELVVVLVAAGAYSKAIVRPSDPASIVLTDNPDLKLQSVAVSESLDAAGTAGEKMTALVGHEVLHVIASMTDLYGPWQDGAWNTPESLAGKIAGLTHLDAVYKTIYGWCRPKSYDISSADHLCVNLTAPSAVDPSEDAPDPVLLYDSSRGGDEFFMLEYRSPAIPTAAGRFDKTISQHGVAIWHGNLAGGSLARRPGYIAAPQTQGATFQPQPPSGDDRLVGRHIDWGPNGVLETAPLGTNVTASGPPINLYASPNGEIGTASGLWRSEHGRFGLRWIDQTDVGIEIQVEDVAPDSPSLRVAIDRRNTPLTLAEDFALLQCRESVSGQRLDTSVGAQDAILYAADSAGSLGWYRHLARLSGDATFANGGNERVLARGHGPGSGWAELTHVISGGDGVLYGVKPDGSLVWYRHEGWQTGDATFANGGNERVLARGHGPGSGWAALTHVISGGDGVLYGVKPDGSLVWYRHEGWQTGDATFANGGNERVLARGRGPGSGWAALTHVISGGDGVLYGVKPDGSLVWYRHEGWQTGDATFANGGNERVLARGRGPGSGWAALTHVISGGDGVLYGVKPDGSLVWYRHEGWQTGDATFANGGNERVLARGRGPGSGWAALTHVAVASR